MMDPFESETVSYFNFINGIYKSTFYHQEK